MLVLSRQPHCVSGESSFPQPWEESPVGIASPFSRKGSSSPSRRSIRNLWKCSSPPCAPNWRTSLTVWAHSNLKLLGRNPSRTRYEWRGGHWEEDKAGG